MSKKYIGSSFADFLPERHRAKLNVTRSTG